MANHTQAQGRRVLVVLNPKGGNSREDELRDALARAFPLPDACTIYTTTGQEDLPARVRAYDPASFDLVIAAGGDGTVSDVANGLIGADVPLGILPVGTGNVLARDLRVPLAVNDALALLAGPHEIVAIDAMQIGERYVMVSIGCGIDSLMVRDTPRDAKRRFGRLAYAWTITRSLLGFAGSRFTIVADGRRMRRRALQVLVANSAAVGLDPLSWGAHIHPDDGVVDVCVVSARTLGDLAGLLWHALLGRQRSDRNIRYMRARHTVMLAADSPLPVQADGELLGETPLRISVVPGALRVIVPPRQQEAAGNDNMEQYNGQETERAKAARAV